MQQLPAGAGDVDGAAPTQLAARAMNFVRISRAASTASPGPAGTTSTTAPPHKGKPAPRGVHLVTADGSVNCVDTPADQENVVTSLHWCETVAALAMLEEGQRSGATRFGHITLDLAIDLLYTQE